MTLQAPAFEPFISSPYLLLFQLQHVDLAVPYFRSLLSITHLKTHLLKIHPLKPWNM